MANYYVDLSGTGGAGDADGSDAENCFGTTGFASAYATAEAGDVFYLKGAGTFADADFSTGAAVLFDRWPGELAPWRLVLEDGVGFATPGPIMRNGIVFNDIPDTPGYVNGMNNMYYVGAAEFGIAGTTKVYTNSFISIPDLPDLSNVTSLDLEGTVMQLDNNLSVSTAVEYLLDSCETLNIRNSVWDAEVFPLSVPTDCVVIGEGTITVDTLFEVQASDALVNAFYISYNVGPNWAKLAIASIPVREAVVGVEGRIDGVYKYDAWAMSGEKVTWALGDETTAAGATIDADSGVVTWSPTATGTYTIQILAATGFRVAQTFEVIVQEALFLKEVTLSGTRINNYNASLVEIVNNNINVINPVVRSVSNFGTTITIPAAAIKYFVNTDALVTKTVKPGPDTVNAIDPVARTSNFSRRTISTPLNALRTIKDF